MSGIDYYKPTERDEDRGADCDCAYEGAVCSGSEQIEQTRLLKRINKHVICLKPLGGVKESLDA